MKRMKKVNDMLIITFHNTGTGTNESSNYDVQVWVNRDVIAHYSLKEHNRYRGWINLLQMLVNQAKAEKNINDYSDILNLLRDENREFNIR